MQRGTETILLVEDNEQVRQLTSSVLADCGYKVLPAASPEEGLALCRANHPNIQLLVTDVILPRMKGPRACRASETDFPAYQGAIRLRLHQQRDRALWRARCWTVVPGQALLGIGAGR